MGGTLFADCTPHSNSSDQLIEFDTTPQCNQVDDQPLSEVTPKPFWFGKTQICPNCDKRVLGRLMQRHSESCKPVQISSNSQTSPLKISKTVLESLPEFSLDDRITHLNKFEVLLLTPVQVKEFNDLYSKKKFDVQEPIFHSWLSLKLASVPAEAEALDRVLKAHTMQNVPKRKQKRAQNLPTGIVLYFIIQTPFIIQSHIIGAARYDPTSPEWVSCLEEQENKKKKVSQKTTNSKPNYNSKPAIKTAKKKLRV